MLSRTCSAASSLEGVSRRRKHDQRQRTQRRNVLIHPAEKKHVDRHARARALYREGLVEAVASLQQGRFLGRTEKLGVFTRFERTSSKRGKAGREDGQLAASRRLLGTSACVRRASVWTYDKLVASLQSRPQGAAEVLGVGEERGHFAQKGLQSSASCAQVHKEI